MSKRILIVGSGVVGEATGTVLAQHGFDIFFTDVSAGVVNRLREKGYQSFETRELDHADVDMYMLSVPTYPLDLCHDQAEAERLEKSMSPIEWCDVGIDFTKSAAATIGKWLAAADQYQVVVIRSAVLPGTTEDMVIPILQEQSGKRAGVDFGVCVNPEYLRERVAIQDIASPWVNVIGELDKRSGDPLQEVYAWSTAPLYRITIKEAEMQKFIHNLINATKISFFNEMRLICERIGVDAETVIPIVARSAEALWNPEYGTKDYGPFGGKCLPKDTVAFVAWAQRSGWEARMVKAAIEVNDIYEKKLQELPASM
ncbi:MAG: hypothetical protein Q8Q07_06170 [Dehalococcoidales bacterium]|nr:hypothetical protein [Dehalococcoidales bacterium]